MFALLTQQVFLLKSTCPQLSIVGLTADAWKAVLQFSSPILIRDLSVVELTFDRDVEFATVGFISHLILI